MGCRACFDDAWRRVVGGRALEDVASRRSRFVVLSREMKEADRVLSHKPSCMRLLTSV